MSIEKVKAYLNQYGAADRVMQFDVSSATVELAARAIGCAPERIAKSILLSISERVIMVVAAGDARIDNPKFKTRFEAKATMLKPDQVLKAVGYPVGGVCPFAVNPGVEIYLDQSLYRFETVFPACGTSDSAIELTLPELELFTGFSAKVDVCKGWQ